MSEQGINEHGERIGIDAMMNEAQPYGTFAYNAPFHTRRPTVSSFRVNVKVIPFLVAFAFVGNLYRSSLSDASNTDTDSLGTLPFDIEANFLKVPEVSTAMKHLKYYSSEPHSAGTRADYERAVYTVKEFRKHGIEAEIKEYFTLLSFPIHRHVAIVEPKESRRTLKLKENVVPGDDCTSSTKALPPFLAYSPSANVTAPVIYLNYGRIEDFEYLLSRNISLVGKIGIARYGLNFRGVKIMLAQNHGMAGLLIYSDPSDDGFTKGNVYPDGPWRPETSVQRGSAQFNSIYSGDPLTPGYAATASASRLKIDEAPNLPKIPVHPLSYGDAYHILNALQGEEVPVGWRGGLDLVYRIGPGQVKVNIDLTLDNHVGPIWDVIGKIPGEIEDDRYVIIGNHRDAWVCGACDPHSGSSALLEVARGFGSLMKQGWKPRRTIILSSWDGEEYGLLGSTEWVEDHKNLLFKNAVAYINVDSFKGKTIFAQSSPAMSKLILHTSKKVKLGNSTIYQQYITQRKQNRTENEVAILHKQNYIDIVGSGSDYTPFLQYFGIISANLGFNGSYGVYHSSMDTFSWVEKYGDPLFKHHMAIAKWWGLITLRLADSKVLPLDYTSYSFVLEHYLDKFSKDIESKNIHLNYSSCFAAIKKFKAAAFHVEEQRINIEASKDATLIRSFNDKLMYSERLFLNKLGLKHRPHFRHMVFAPAYYLGYGATAFPGIADAIALNDNKGAFEEQLQLVTQVINEAAEFLLGKRTVPLMHF